MLLSDADFDLSPVAVVPEAIREYRLDALGVRLRIASATEGNRAYFSAALVTSAAKAGGARTATPETVADGREEDVTLFASHVLRGWDGVKTRAGEDVPFTTEHARAWLSVLARKAPHEWVALRNFATDPANFTARATGGLEGNS